MPRSASSGFSPSRTLFRSCSISCRASSSRYSAISGSSRSSQRRRGRRVGLIAILLAIASPPWSLAGAAVSETLCSWRMVFRTSPYLALESGTLDSGTPTTRDSRLAEADVVAGGEQAPLATAKTIGEVMSIQTPAPDAPIEVSPSSWSTPGGHASDAPSASVAKRPTRRGCTPASKRSCRSGCAARRMVYAPPISITRGPRGSSRG